MSKETTKKGVSLAEKEQASEFTMEDLANHDFSDQLAIDPVLKKEIEDQGLKYRWVNASQLAANHGYDKRMWVPYKRKSAGNSNAYGQTDAEGYVRRADLILAVQSARIYAQRAALVEQRNLANKAATGSKQAAMELKEMFKQRNDGQVKVVDDDKE